jgi:hypothetical protein
MDMASEPQSVIDMYGIVEVKTPGGYRPQLSARAAA